MSDDGLIERAIDEAPIGITIADATREDDPLIYINDAFERLTGYPPEETLGTNCRFLQGERTAAEPVATMREAIEAEEPTSVELRNYRKDGTEFWNKVDIAPIHEDGDVTHFVGFQTDVTARKRAEREVKRRVREVERERRKLQDVLDRIEGLLEDITRTLVGATTREGIERAVCDRLVAEGVYDAAWIGERDPTTEEIVPETWAGALDPAASALPTDRREDPAACALVSGDARFVAGEDVPAWHETVREQETRAMAALPLISGETVYGVLVVYAARPDAFDDHERVVLESIGRAIANACNTLESRRILTADSAAQLTFDLGSEDLFFVSLSARTGCRFEYEGSATDGDSLLFFTVEGLDPTAILDLAADYESVTETTVLTANDTTGLVEFRLSGISLVTKLANRGVRIRSMHADRGSGRLGLVVPGGVNPRSVVELITESCPNATLVASREYNRPPQTDDEYRLSVEGELTDRQRLALRKTYVSGYFDPDRRISGQEIAASMGISRSTFHQHLRAAHRKLLGEFFDRELPD
ncbi:bacterio-opsin activator domain-containing protein [Halalkalicoccus jeotgali]|uniref:Bacterio-opsin activator n=1 Tax=Halalkalicoccus jeotgali (strain DSM 18796 / CECT 7217 / JCM 14584 / KCTC 4019 / B3) TaxID=795797 RepID=D8J3G3_HALJB|nr:bacterio-opsin activator domain-containing protein [Halalkalicoccus jeotgali]ADJ15270.1 bacterio-opsin activator [Halalkalicoccus jeotgali B3]ELY35309.1 bacterio-opsin activator [Halalkalicoccus jeotgali B3]